MKATPTPTPTIATAIVASGDPIAIINGYRIKFDIPSGKDHLLWKTPESELMARADLITPDKSSQWFSDFIFLCHGQRLLHIERKEIVSDADATVNTLSTLMLRLTTTDGVERVTTPGEYKVSKEGVMVIVKHDTSKIGDTPRDIVTVSSMDITFDVVPQLAKKFTDLNMAMKYVHIDINMRKMSSNVIGGMFAEMWGFVPMSKHTAQLIRKVKRMQ